MGSTVHDVAAYVLRKQGTMSAFKLQKLCYYSQAWHLAFYDGPLYSERTEAWVNGPVAPDLYAQHRRQLTVSRVETGDPGRLAGAQRTHIDRVLDAYSGFAAHELVEMTHREAPWRDARAGLTPFERSSVEITFSAMRDFYRRLSADQDAEELG